MMDQALKEQRIEKAVDTLGRDDSTDARVIELFGEEYVTNHLGRPEPMGIALEKMDTDVLDALLAHTYVDSAQQLFDTYTTWHVSVFGEEWSAADHKHFKAPAR